MHTLIQILYLCSMHLNVCFRYLLLLTIGGCSDPLPTGVDSVAWKANYQSCTGDRLAAWVDFKSTKERFIGVSEQSVLKVLGMPDRQELYLRNQRIFYYYITPGAQCGGTYTAKGEQIYLRISATNKVTEINIFRGI